METDVMENEIHKSPFRWTKKKVVIVSLISFILLMLATAAQISYMILKDDRIYKGIYVNQVYAGGLTSHELNSLLDKNFIQKSASTVIELKSQQNTEKLSLSELDVAYDVEQAVKKAYSLGHSGNIFERFYDIFQARFNNKVVLMTYKYNHKKLQDKIDVFYKKTQIPVKEADLTIQESNIIIRSGHHGENIDKNKTIKDLETRIQLCQGGTLDIPVIITSPSKVDADDYFTQINQEVRDATVQIMNNQTTFTREAIGRSIDKNLLISQLAELEGTENTEKSLPVLFVKPKITLQQIYGSLFKDELYSFRSTFKTRTQNERNRGTNIRLDVAKINGKILAPGEVFSYNATVGSKSPQTGYKEAFTYVGGKLVAGLGGGICQVSTTLYNAVLNSDLEVVERRNHQFLVTYVPFGQDATVYYDTTDFKFKNNTQWPLQIKGSVTEKNQVVFTIMGTKDVPEKTVKIISKPVGKPIAFPIKYVDDPSLSANKEVIEQTGHVGGVYETYKIVMLGGKVISTNKISTSHYKPLEQIVKRAPQKVVPVNPKDPKPDTPPPIDNPDVVQ